MTPEGLTEVALQRGSGVRFALNTDLGKISWFVVVVLFFFFGVCWGWLWGLKEAFRMTFKWAQSF